MALTVAQLEKFVTFVTVDRYMVPSVVKPMRLNDKDREQWISNDYDLYNWQQNSRKSMRKFIRENRMEIDKYIHQQLDKKPVS